MEKNLKLNLGCGANRKSGYINVDKYGEPDLQHDLETFPWPWPDSSVKEIVLNHVLEHLGQITDVFLNIMQEMYRVCQDEAKIFIVVPHPRHDDFQGDPTHVRKITPEGFGLFSKKNNDMWIKGGYANSPLGHYLNIDFEITNVSYIADPAWAQRLQDKKITQEQLNGAARQYNNVIKEIRLEVTAIK